MSDNPLFSFPIPIYITIAQAFTTFCKILSEKNNLLPQHVFTPTAIQAFLQKETDFDIPNIEQFRTIENNPHNWFHADILQNSFRNSFKNPPEYPNQRTN